LRRQHTPPTIPLDKDIGESSSAIKRYALLVFTFHVIDSSNHTSISFDPHGQLR
jgi:hypothetical protein